MMLNPTCICCLIRPNFSSVQDKPPLSSNDRNEAVANEGPAHSNACVAQNCCFKKLNTSAGSHLHRETFTLPESASDGGLQLKVESSGSGAWNEGLVVKKM